MPIISTNKIVTTFKTSRAVLKRLAAAGVIPAPNPPAAGGWYEADLPAIRAAVLANRRAKLAAGAEHLRRLTAAKKLGASNGDQY